MLDLASGVRAVLLEQIVGFHGPAEFEMMLIQYALDESRLQQQGLGTGEMIGLWRVTSIGVDRVPLIPRGCLTGPTVSFCVNADDGEAYVEWYFGPLAGYGMKYKIKVDGDSVTLEDGERTWVS